MRAKGLSLTKNLLHNCYKCTILVQGWVTVQKEGPVAQDFLFLKWQNRCRMGLFHHYFSPVLPVLTCSQDSLSEPSVRVFLSSAEVPKQTTLSADWALHHSGKHFQRGPRVDALVVDAVDAQRLSLSPSLSLNPMRWAFFWAARRRINPGVAANVSWTS